MSRSGRQAATGSAVSPRLRLRAAFADLRAGRIAAAAAAVPVLLEIDPAQSDVHNLAGLLALERHDPLAAARHLEQAIQANPNEPVYHCNLGEARRQLQQMDLAIASQREALRLNPAYLTAAINLGSVCFA